MTAFFALDSYDVLLISECPDDVSAADISIRCFVSGDVANIHTTKLLDASQVLEVVHQNAPPSYRPTPRAKAFSASAS